MEDTTGGSAKKVWLHLEKDVHYPLLVLQSLLVVLKVFKRLRPTTERKAVLHTEQTLYWAASLSTGATLPPARGRQVGRSRVEADHCQDVEELPGVKVQQRADEGEDLLLV